MQKDGFPLYNTNQKVKLVTKNEEPEQKACTIIYCILFTWEKNNYQITSYY